MICNSKNDLLKKKTSGVNVAAYPMYSIH